MPRVGFEPTIPVFERARTVHALYRAVTVTGRRASNRVKCECYVYATENLAERSNGAEASSGNVS
jgi:hypothetical protein